MTREAYGDRAMANLRAMSRTANGEVDTSASADKKDRMAVTDGETAKALALRNFEAALDMAWQLSAGQLVCRYLIWEDGTSDFAECVYIHESFT